MVANGVQALEALSRYAYAAVLMDCEMPEMDGYETARRIRPAEPDGHRLPIIALTAHTQPGDRERCFAAGMDEYLTKPIDALELAIALDRWVRAPPADH